MIARTYSTASVVSEDMPFAVRYSSKEVRRNVPLIRNSKGMGFSDCKRVLTSVESAKRRKSAWHISRYILGEVYCHCTCIDQDRAWIFRQGNVGVAS